jgi:hypothetical protein
MEASHSVNPQVLSSVIKGEKENSGASFTVVSKKTGKDFTYKISKSKFQGRFYTHVRIEQGYLNFNYLGMYANGSLWRKKAKVNTPASTGIAWILKRVEEENFALLEDSIELLHLGSCLRCGRTLTDQNSIQLGLGPTCASY